MSGLVIDMAEDSDIKFLLGCLEDAEFLRSSGLGARELCHIIETTRFVFMRSCVMNAFRALLQTVIPSPKSSCSSANGQISTSGALHDRGRLEGLLGLCTTLWVELVRMSLRPRFEGELVSGV